MNHRLLRARPSAKSGSALIVIGVLIVVMAGLMSAMLTVALGGRKEVAWAQSETRALYIAEAAASAAIEDYAAGGSGELGTEQAPVDFGGSQYWVTATDLGDGRLQLRATGVAGIASATMEIVVEEGDDPLLSFGLFGDDEVLLNSNAVLDSYDSRLGDYASQVTGKYKGTDYALTNGHIGSNADIELDSNAKVFGDAIPGPSGGVSFGSNAYVMGDTTPAADPVVMPSIVVPSIASSGDYTIGGSTTETLGPGSYHFDYFELDSNAEVTVVGPATLVLDEVEILSNTQFWVDGTAGPVTIYATGDFNINSNASMQSLDKDPLDITINITSDTVVDGTEFNMDSNGEFHGTIFGPYADLNLDSNFQIFGAVRVRSLTLNSNSQIHLDEALMGGGGSGSDFTILSWRLAETGRISL